jgi:hypothetical protein
MKRNIYNLFFYWITLLSLILLVFEQFSLLNYGDSIVGNSFICNSDSLICYAYCKDVMNHIHNIANWSLGKFMSYFVNCMIMWLILLFTTKTILVQFIYGIVQFFLLIFSFNYLFKTIFKTIDSFTLSISNLLLSLLIVYSMSYSDFIFLTNSFFLPYQTGSFIGVVISLILFLNYLKISNNLTRNLFIFTHILSIISNPIAIVYLSVPLIGTFLLLYIFNKIVDRKQSLRILVLLLITTIIGYITYSTIKNTFYNVKYELGLFTSFEAIAASFKFMFNQYFVLITNNKLMGSIMVLVIISLVFSIYNSLKFLFFSDKFAITNKYFKIYSLYFVLFFILSFFAPAVCGIYFDGYSIRYNIVIIFVSLLNIGLNLEFIRLNYTINRYIIPSVFGVLFIIYFSFIFYTAIKVSPFECFNKIEAYYPPLVKATDELSKNYNVKNGIGDYWDAGFVSNLSKNDVRVTSVFQDLRPYLNYCNYKNYYWTDYTQKKRVIYNFISLRNFNDTTTAWKIFDHTKIKKVLIDGYPFYIVPDFVLNEQTNNIEIIK